MTSTPSSTVVAAVVGVAAAAVGMASLFSRPNPTDQIVRMKQSDPRMSQLSIYNGVVYMSGQVANLDTLDQCSVTEQTQQTLAKIDALLAEAGTDKSRVLSATIWLKDIDRDFKEMNAVWNAWVQEGHKGVRACVSANMARPSILVEVQVVAAVGAGAL
jgi:enamine deaminase RidA (YjgF/YER057c/UK114 family)